MQTTTRLQERAREFADAFTHDKRDDGTEYTHLRDGSPEWMHEVCREAHKDGSPGIDGTPGQGFMFPDDWRYQFIEDAAELLAETDDPDEIDIEADIYTHDLTRWLASRTDRYDYCDQFVNECGLPSEGTEFSTISLLQGGQYTERREVLDIVRSALEAQE